MRKIELTLIIIMHCLWVNAQTDCPPVTKLKSTYTKDNNFKQRIDSMFLKVQDLPDGSQDFWKNKNINNLYPFPDRWIVQYNNERTHSGKIKVKPKEDEGSFFIINLPVV